MPGICLEDAGVVGSWNLPGICLESAWKQGQALDLDLDLGLALAMGQAMGLAQDQIENRDC
jgi:hypothetical protein